jgi:hypothetical protein
VSYNVTSILVLHKKLHFFTANKRVQTLTVNNTFFYITRNRMQNPIIKCSDMYFIIHKPKNVIENASSILVSHIKVIFFAMNNNV